jgi:hypothetical protein
MKGQVMDITANNDKAKCEGIGCAYRTSCGRYLRPEGGRQTWAAYYAMTGDDCDEFEPVIELKFIPYKHMLCNNCLKVRDFEQAADAGEVLCECGGDWCGCHVCIETANKLNQGLRKKRDTLLLNDIADWNAINGCVDALNANT